MSASDTIKKEEPVAETDQKRTNDVKSRLGLKFDDFHLKESLIKGIVAMGFYEPSPVQEESIPHIIEGRDAMIRSKNGTGKTATYLIPILNMVDPSIEGIQALVLLPTRELIIQTVEIANELAQFMDIKTVGVIGGRPINEDLQEIDDIKPLVVVGTTTRVQHVMEKGRVKGSDIRVVVLDEADQVIVNDQSTSLRLIMSKMPRVQLILISATFPAEISEFQTTYMENPIVINLMTDLTLEGITQFYVYLQEEEKLSCMNALLHKLNVNQCIIFCNSFRRVEMLAQRLNNMGYPSVSIHSRMYQKQRTSIFKDFQEGKFRYLVSSDLFNRGIDVMAVNVVINFDIPRNTSAYLHRIGRSGRFGTYSISITMVTQKQMKTLKAFEKELDIKIQPTPSSIPESIYVNKAT